MHRFVHSLTTILLVGGALISPLQAHAHTTKTPIKHLVIIFQENRTFDHYFGTYPFAENNKNEPPFSPRWQTPSINGLSRAHLKNNTNLAQPFRFSPSQANTSSPDHTYQILQEACDSGLLDMFVQTTGAECVPPSTVMGYFDGNTVTALWNYAQYFAMNDNCHTTTIGPSTIGAINLVSGQTHGALPASLVVGPKTIVIDGTIINDTDPKYDACSKTPATVEMTGINIGNLLNKKGVTWGWFQGGFHDCSATHIGPREVPVLDYVPHHNPFQYYKSTSNPKHHHPSSIKKIGKTDRANHQYDLADFWKAAQEGIVPSVSFLKARAFENGHAVNSDPLFEQRFLVSTLNRLQKLPQWEDMAVIITYDDSGGWYDHEVPPLINQSQTSQDAFAGPGSAGTVPPLGGYQARPAYGFRVPFLVISPWAKENYVDHTLIDQTSIIRFIEDNWGLKRIGNFSFDKFADKISNMFDFKKRHPRTLILHKKTGEIKKFISQGG